MTNQELFYRHLGLGNYSTAAEAGEKALREDNISFQEKISLRADLAELREFGSRWKSAEAGVAYFPVVFNNGEGAILGIKCGEDIAESQTDKSLCESFRGYMDFVTQFLDDLLKRYSAQPAVVFDWKLYDLKFRIQGHPFESSEYRELFKETFGRSYILALIAAAVSYRIKIPVPVNMFFSGDVEKNNNAGIIWVNGLEIKSGLLQKEMPGSRLMARYNGQSGNERDDCSALKDIFDEISGGPFPDIHQLLKDLPYTSITKLQADLVDESDFGIIKERDVTLIDFTPWDDHEYKYNTKLALFFDENIGIFKSGGRVIVSNLRLNYMPAMLAANRNLTNHVGDFLAFYHSGRPVKGNGDPLKEYFVAVIVRTRNNAPRYKTGDTIYFYRKN